PVPRWRKPDATVVMIEHFRRRGLPRKRTRPPAADPLRFSAPREFFPVLPQRVFGLPIHPKPLENRMDKVSEACFVAPTRQGEDACGALPSVGQSADQGDLEI